jgi:hypothetical protein
VRGIPLPTEPFGFPVLAHTRHVTDPGACRMLGS